MSSHVFCLFLNLDFCCRVLKYVFWILISYQIYDFQLLCPFLWVFFYSLDSVLWCILIFSFDEGKFIYFPACAFGVTFWKSLSHPVSWKVFTLFSSKSFILLTLTLRGLWSILIFFVYSIRIRLHFVACRYPVFPKPFVEKTVLPSLMILVPLLKISLPYIWGFISGLCSMLLVCESVCVPIPHCLYYLSFVLCFKIRKCESTPTFFNMFLAIWGPMRIHMNFTDFCRTPVGFW